MKRKILSAGLVATFLLSGCGGDREITPSETQQVLSAPVEWTGEERKDFTNTGYRDSVCVIPAVPGCKSHLNAIRYSDSKYYAVVGYSSSEFYTSYDRHIVYEISPEGNIVNQADIDTSFMYDYTVCGDKLIGINQGRTLDFISTQTGETEMSIELDGYGDANTVRYINDDYILVYINGEHKVVRYNINGDKLGEIQNDEFNCSGSYEYFPFFVQDEVLYFVCYGESVEYTFYKLDFENGTSEIAAEVRNSFQTFPGCEFRGQYIYDNDGIEKFNPITGDCQRILLWNNVNVHPQMSPIETKDWNSGPLDDCHIVDSYVYSNGNVEIQMYEYDETIDYSDRIQITVGGYGQGEEVALNIAVYLFNTSQDEYRAVIENYTSSYESTAQGTANAIAARIQQFNNGNTPDIFFGPYFDYEYLGRNGMVLNMAPYIDGDILLPNMKDLMIKDDVCYQVFSGYQLMGYIGRNDVFEDLTDINYSDFYALSSDGVYVSDIENASSISCGIINNSLNSGVPSIAELTDIVTCAVDNGKSVNDTNFDWYQIEGVRDGLILSYNSAIGSLEMYHDDCEIVGDTLTYIGYPSVSGSNHVVHPFGIAAVCANTEYPEACCEFISYLLSDEVQLMTMNNSQLPVVESVWNLTCDYALDVESIPDEDFSYRGLFARTGSFTQEEIDELRDAVTSADTLDVFDGNVTTIVYDEVESYYLQGKTPGEIADSLYSRLSLYMDEYYS